MKLYFIKVTGLAALMLFTSCVTVFTPMKQKVAIVSKTAGSTIYLDEKKIGNNKVETKLKRDKKLREIKITKDNYKDKNGLVYQSKTNMLILADIPFVFVFIGIYGLYIDGMSRKNRSYEKEFVFEPMVKIPSKPDSLKYLLVNKTSINIEPGDTIGKHYYKVKDYVKGKLGKSIVADEKTVYENTTLTNDLNRFLTEWKYTDTTKSLIPNNTNSAFINGSIESYEVESVSNGSYTDFRVLRLQMKWVFEDIYGNELLTVKTSERSDQFSGKADFELIVSDALEYSLIELLSKKDVTELLTPKAGEEDLNKNLPQLTIERPKMPATIKSSLSSSVTIKTKEGHGSGFLISDDGYIVTNYHVVAQNDTVEVFFSDGEKVKAKVERFDYTNDLALIKTIEQMKGNYAPILVSESKEIDLGANVHAIGTPSSIELGQTISKGIISGERKYNDNVYIQTDVSINKGNSGGPLIANGAVVGVVSNKVIGVGVEGIGFAIPSYYIFSQLKIDYK